MSTGKYESKDSWLFARNKVNRFRPNDKQYNHNYNKLVKSDWLSTALISTLIGQFNRTLRVMPK